MNTFERFIPIHKQLIRELIFEALGTDGFRILIKNDLELWDFELPEEQRGEVMVLDITGWCKDQCYMNEDSFSIVTAFGDDEYKIELPLENILQIVTLEGTAVLYQKSLPFLTEVEVEAEVEAEEPKKLSINHPNTKGMIHSMESLKKHNPNFKKKK